MKKKEAQLMARLIRIRKDVVKCYFALKELSKENMNAGNGGPGDLDISGLRAAQDDCLVLNQTLMELESNDDDGEAKGK